MSAAGAARPLTDLTFTDASEALACSHVGASPAIEAAAEPDVPARWEWRGDLGIGGMGRVSLVHDHRLGRDIALKEAVSDADARLLHREALITAALEHPGIVPVYDVGRSLEGRPWYAMRVVRGRSLAAVLAERPPLPERMALLRRVLGAIEAVAFAHARGVVHRDLKPANLMLGNFGEIQVIDWGLAHAPPTLDGHPVVDLSVIAGTPRTMSPEQARGEPVTPASDVWSLGAILWEVCAGRPAFKGPREEVMAEVRAGRAPPLAEPGVPSELRAIIARAMAPTPAERYRDAAALARDLERFLDGRRVSAYEYGLGANLRRFLRAWRVPLQVAAVAAIVLSAMLAVGLARLSREESQSSSNLALALAGEANRALQVDARGEAEVLAAHALANGAIVDARGVLAALSSPRPRRTLIADAPCAPVDVVGATLLCRTPTDVALWREGTLRWRSPAVGNHHAMLLDGGAAVLVIYRAAYQRLDAESGAPFAPPEPVLSNLFRAAGDGRSAVGRAAGTLLRVRGRETTRVAVGGGSDIGAAAIDASGERWAALLKSGELVLGRFGESSVRRLATAVGAPRLEGSVLAFVPGGDELVAGTTLGGLVRIATRDGAHVPFWSSRGNVRELLVSPDGKRLVASWDALSPLVIGLDDGVSLGRLPWRGRAAMRWAGATELITADHEIVRWDFAAVVARAVQVSTGIVAVSVSSDGTRLAIANGAEVAVVDSRTHARLGEARWQDQFVKDVAFVPGSHDLVAHGFGDARLAHIDARLALDHRFGAHSIWRRIAVLAGGAVLAARYKSGVELYRDPHDEPELVTPITMYDLVTSPDGHLVAALGDGQVFVGQDLETGGRLTPCASDVAALAVAVLPDGGVVVASPDAVTERCGPVTRRYDVPSDADLISVVASIRWVAAGDRDGTVWLWRTGFARPHAVFRDHQGRVPALALDPMGKWLAAGDWSGRLSFFDLSEDAGDQRGIAEAAWGLTLDLAFGRRGTSDVSHP